jgi:hypothetical protein
LFNTDYFNIHSLRYLLGVNGAGAGTGAGAKEVDNVNGNINVNINKRVIYSVTDGIQSPQTRHKYAYHFKCFIEHFDGITEDSLLTKAEQEPRAMQRIDAEAKERQSQDSGNRR